MFFSVGVMWISGGITVEKGGLLGKDRLQHPLWPTTKYRASSHIWDDVAGPFHILGDGLRSLTEAMFVIPRLHILPPGVVWTSPRGRGAAFSARDLSGPCIWARLDPRIRASTSSHPLLRRLVNQNKLFSYLCRRGDAEADI